MAWWNSAILNSAMLDSDFCMLDSDTLLSSLRFTPKTLSSTLTLTQTNSIWLKLIHSQLILMMAAILNSAILDSAILDLQHTLTCFSSASFDKKKHSHSHSASPPFAQKFNFTHSFSLNLMMAAILNSAILDSDILDSASVCGPLRHLDIFSQRSIKKTLPPSDSDSNKFILTQTHSFSLNLMMAAILNSAILNFSHLGFSHLSFSSFKLTHTCQDWFPSWILHILYFYSHLDSASALWKRHPSLRFILKHSPPLDDGGHLEFCHFGFRHCHLGFRHLVIFSLDSLKNTLPPLWLWQTKTDSNSFILT